MAKDNMTITATADWDYEDAVKKLNKGLKKIEQRLNALSIKAKLDEKSNTELQNLIQKLNKVKKIANQIEKKGINLNTKTDSSTDKMLSELQEIKQTINKINSQNVEIDTKSANNNIENLSDSLDSVKQSADGAGNKLKNMLADIGINVSAMQAFEMLKNILNDITDAVKEFDKYNTNLKIITGGADAEVKELIADYADKSIKMGIDIGDVENAAEAILRTGKNADDTNKILEDSLTLSKTGFIDSEKAADNLITIGNAYNLEADAIENVVDKLLALDVASQTEGGALSTAVAKTAQNAQLAGVTLDSLAAQIANLRDTTGKTEEELATSLNSIFSRMYNVKLNKFEIETDSGVEDISEDINDMERVLSKVGIKLRDTQNTFRDFDDILKDLHNNWSDFNDVEQRAIGKTLGGTYHQNTVIAMIKEYEDFQKLQEISITSTGTAAERYGSYLDSIEAKSNSLNTAINQLFSNTISSEFIGDMKSATTEVVQFIDKYEILQNLLKSATVYAAAKGFVYLGGTLIDAYRSLSNLSGAFNLLNTFQSAAGGTTAYNTALLNLGGSMQLLSQSQIKLLLSTSGLTEAQRIAILEASGMSSAEAKAALATMGLSASEDKASASTFSLSGAFKALSASIKANPILTAATALMGLMSVISIVKNKQEEAIQQQKELERQRTENVKTFQEESSSIDGLLSKYVELVSQNTDLSVVKKDLTEIQNQLIDTYGVEADSIDLLNGKLSENVTMLRERKRVLAEEYVHNEDNRKAYDDAVFQLEAGKGSTVSTGTAETENFWKLDLEGWIEKEAIRAWQDAGLNFSAQISDTKPTDLFAYGDLDEKKNTWLKMAEIYKMIDGHNEATYNQLMEYYEGAKQLQTELTATKNTMESNLSFLEFNNTSEFDALIAKAIELNQTMQGDGTVTERFAASQELEALQNEIYETAGSNAELKDIADSTFAAFETGASNAATSAADLRNAFYESLEDMQKGSLKNVESIEDAMQTLANGEYISWDDFWALNKLDTDDALLRVEQIGEEVKLNSQELQQMKDNYVNSEIESLQKQNQAIQDQVESKNGVVNGLKDQLEYELLILDAQIAQGANSAGDEKRINDQKQKVQEIRDKIEDYGDQVKRNNLLIQMWNTHLGDTVDKTEMLKKRQEQLNEQMEKMQDNADNYAKAMTSKIDSVIDSHEAEKDVLDKEKEVLDEQLGTLEEQQKAIEDIIDDYKSVVDMVGDVTDKEIELLKKQQEAEENAVQAKIDALKEAREQQEEENTLTEKQLELQEKLRDLEKARQAKVRTYSEERGWHFDVDKEAVANAQTAVDEAQADYDKAVDDKAYNDQLKALEKEKELISDNFETQIKAFEEYAEQWQAILDEQTEAENEQIAQQILGSEWREKIKAKDTEVLNKFKSNFQGYNTQLNNLINTEIANLKLSIKAKEDEIKAKEKQIQSWKDYKSQVENSINAIKGKYEDYVDFLNQIGLDENSSYEDRERALANFVNNYQGYVDEIQNIQSQLSDIEVNLTLNTNFEQARWETAEFITQYIDAIKTMNDALKASSTGFAQVNSNWDEDLARAGNYLDRINGWELMGFHSCAKGGVVDYTGLTMLHGEKQRPEVVFNAAQSKQLYDMVMKGDFADLAAARAAEGFTSVLKSIESKYISNNNNIHNANNSSVVIQHMDINGVQNPVEFAKEFNKNMDQYWRIKLSESRVR